METYEIIIGIVTAAFLIFLRNANQMAHRQKVVAVRLNSYLAYWKSLILERDLFKLFYVGVSWNEEIREILSTGGKATDIVKLEEEKKKLLEKIKESLESDQERRESLNTAASEALSKIPAEYRNEILNYLKATEQNLIDGKTYISDEDASYFDQYTAHECIALKMRLISLMSGVVILLLHAAQDEEFDMNNYSSEFKNILWQGLLVSKGIDILSTSMDQYSSKSVLLLTLDNMGL
ncbi:MAG: hypothetical protein JAZ13_06315 [Candidatus Thiodiazotropha taylori]|nr:hypothetical protein [Candidatus Thiodiazotropha taylori]